MKTAVAKKEEAVFREKRMKTSMFLKDQTEDFNASYFE
jgi:hypothetical protein